MVDGEWIPIAMFAMIFAIVAVVLYYRNERMKITSGGGGEYRKIAEEAVRGQTVMLEEIRRMNATLKEIEKLLREV